MKKHLSLLLALVLLLTLTIPAFAAGAEAMQRDMPFEDVAPEAWYADAVRAVYAAEWMVGTGDKSFSPDQELTWAQLVTILWRRSGSPVGDWDAVLPDGAVWYAQALNWAAAEQLIPFGPEAGLDPGGDGGAAAALCKQSWRGAEPGRRHEHSKRYRCGFCYADRKPRYAVGCGRGLDDRV